MARRANITSIDAVRIFQAALIEFQGELRDVLPTLLVEVRRTGEWIDSDRARYWPNQYRIACEAVVVATTTFLAASGRCGPTTTRAATNSKWLCSKPKIECVAARRRCKQPNTGGRR